MWQCEIILKLKILWTNVHGHNGNDVLPNIRTIDANLIYNHHNEQDRQCRYRIITFVDVDFTVYKYKLRARGIVALHVKLISSGYLDRSYAFFYAWVGFRVSWIETQSRIWSDLLEFTVPLYSNLKKTYWNLYKNFYKYVEVYTRAR